jgi:hypothetical protein
MDERIASLRINLAVYVSQTVSQFTMIDVHAGAVPNLSMVWSYRTELVGVGTSVPNTIQQLVIAMEVSCVVGDLALFIMRHSRKVDRNRFDCDTTGSVVNQSQVSESAPNMILIGRKIAPFSRLEPVRLIHTGILGSVAADVGDP